MKGGRKNGFPSLVRSMNCKQNGKPCGQTEKCAAVRKLETRGLGPRSLVTEPGPVAAAPIAG